jgi:hypothetical protein
MNGQKHIIYRQVLELTIPERGRALPIQNKTAEIVKDKLHPALDRLFSGLTAPEQIIRIDKLEIDIGTIAESDFDKLLVEKCLKEIGRKINQIKFSEKGDIVKTPAKGKSAKEGGKHTVVSKSNDLLDRFVYFLQFGRFPWWHKSETIPEKPGLSQLEIIFTEVLKLETPALKSAIIPLLSNPSVRKRLIYQFSHPQLDALLNRIDSTLFESFFSIYRFLSSLATKRKNRNDLTDSFYKVTLHYFGIVHEIGHDRLQFRFAKEVLTVFLNQYSFKKIEIVLIEFLETLKIKQSRKSRDNFAVVVAALVQSASELRTQNTHLEKIMADILTESGPVVQYMLNQFNEKTLAGSVENRKHNESLLGNEDEGIAERESKTAEKPISLFPPKTSAGVEGIIVSNAGLVLIHHFLRYFFDGLGLLDKELNFKSQTDVFKAIHLLQFIATGQLSTPESDLALNKILCGLDINEPVPMEFPISEIEKEECLNLILTVLERWKELKTTNPAALRETYLKREGILKPTGPSWNLTIERNTFDVMLEKLPWSINLIKLPWLSQILYVEW